MYATYTTADVPQTNIPSHTHNTVACWFILLEPPTNFRVDIHVMMVVIIKNGYITHNGAKMIMIAMRPAPIGVNFTHFSPTAPSIVESMSHSSLNTE